MNNPLFTATVTIASGQTVSTILNLKGIFYPVSIIMPAAWTAAELRVKASYAAVNRPYGGQYDTPAAQQPAEPAIGGGTFFDVYTPLDDTIISMLVSANHAYMMQTAIHANYIALVSSNAQAADRVITIAYRAIE